MGLEERNISVEIWRRATEIFDQLLKARQTSAARFFAILLIMQWAAAIVAAITISPYSWSETSNYFQLHLYLAIVMGGLLCLVPVFFIRTAPTSRLTQYSIVISQVLFSTLLIHLTGGRIETHFHIFGSLAFIAFFRDAKLLLIATVIIAVDHFLRGVYWPQSVYGVLTVAPWRTFEHVAWVIFEDIFLLYSIQQQHNEMLTIADRQATLERTNEIVDQQVKRRTCELQEMTQDLEKARDKALASEKAKGEFLANMSHEIRTPLNAILGFGELLVQSSNLGDEERETIGIVNTSASHLLNIVNDILDFSKLGQGRMKLNPIVTEFRPFIGSSLKIFTQQLEEKEINCILKISEAIPAVLKFDPVRLRQIITNLVGNAIKFTPGSGAIVVRFDVQKHENEIITISGSVTDSGIGIAPENQNKVFEAFEQVDASHTRRFGGSGLGLSITSQLLRQMGGDITVESKEGVGTCFSFSFQTEICDAVADSQGQDEATVNDDIVKQSIAVGSAQNLDLNFQPKVLVAEDHVVNQRLITILLERGGYQVTLVDDGAKAVECFKQSSFDIVLLDIEMPGLNGVEAMRQIREWQSLNEVQRHTPIIGLSAHALPEDNDYYLAEGMDGYLTKPINRELLFKEIESHLDKTAKNSQ